MGNWSNKLKWAAAGHFKYGVISAMKPRREEGAAPVSALPLSIAPFCSVCTPRMCVLFVVSVCLLCFLSLSVYLSVCLLPVSATQSPVSARSQHQISGAALEGEDLMDCSKVRVKADKWGGAGAFAACDIAKGEVVERGIVRVLTNCDGNENPYVFTWSDDMPNTTWAAGSGASTYYNTCADEKLANTHMVSCRCRRHRRRRRRRRFHCHA